MDFNKMYKNLSDKEKLEWICERIETSHTGRVIIKNNLVKKYRDIINNHFDPNWMIKNKMITKFDGYI